MAQLASASTVPAQSGTVIFNVGGRHYEVLRQTIEARPSTLLASLLDDIGTDSTRPVFVDANPDRFAYILDWYRYGEIHLPADFPTKAILNDARFFLLPDFVKINGSSHELRAADEELRGAAISCVTEHWPTFDEYLAGLITEVRNELRLLSARSRSVEEVGDTEGNLCYDAAKDFALTCWAWKLEVGEIGFVWCDDVNVCNWERVKVLVAELKRRGFECTVLTGDPSVGMHVTLRVYLQRGKLWGSRMESRYDQLDGVGVEHGRT